MSDRRTKLLYFGGSVAIALLIGLAQKQGRKPIDYAVQRAVESTRAPSGGPGMFGPQRRGSKVAAQVTSLSHQFYGVYLQGQKAGWAEHKRVELADGAVRFEVKATLRIARLGEVLNTGITDVVVFEPGEAGRLRMCHITHDVGGQKAETRCQRTQDGQMSITQTSAGNVQTRVVPLTKMTRRDRSTPALVRALRASSGEPVEVWQLHPRQLTDMRVVWRLVSEKETLLQGVPVQVLELHGKNEGLGLEETQRVTADGLALEMTVGPGLRTVLEDEVVAKNSAVSAPDIYRLSTVPLAQRLGLARDITHLRLRLNGLPPALGTSDGRQTRAGEVLDIRRVEYTGLPVVELSAEERKKWLEVTPFIDHEATAISDFARKSAKGATAVERVASMSTALHRYLRYSLATAPLSASGILKERTGDCTEYARLLTAMARSQGLPAREVAGLIYAGDRIGGLTFHAWAEVFVAEAGPEGATRRGRWLATDPTWNATPVDATHITLTHGDQVPIVGVLGGLKAEVLSVER